MEITQKLKILADAAKYDASCASSGSKRKAVPGGLGNTEGMGICHSYTPDGRCVSLLKILLTNHCIYDCRYCINRVSSDIPRAKFSVDEVVQLTLNFYRRNYIEGLFLSSGVIGNSDRTMSEMTAVARSLRETHGFGGYIHLKAVAGCSDDCLTEAGKWADRLSANVELPTQPDLDALAPAKKHEAIESSMSAIQTGIDDEEAKNKAHREKTRLFVPAGQSTQMIVGATASSDATILERAQGLYSGFKLRRVYYTAFSPIPSADPRLPLQAPPLVREHRLYQADWLIRFYGFSPQELLPKEAPDLDLNRDPKMVWALRHPGFFPVDVNRAARADLLRVPGFGVRTVEAILKARRFCRIKLSHLGKLRVPLKRASFFILTDDPKQESATKFLDSPKLAAKIPEQLDLFESATDAASGQL